MNGPEDCSCSHCERKTTGRGKPPCEYYDHHCPRCHERGICTRDRCVAGRRQEMKTENFVVVRLDVKSPDEFQKVIARFPALEGKFEFGEYAALTLHVASDGTFTGRFE